MATRHNLISPIHHSPRSNDKHIHIIHVPDESARHFHQLASQQVVNVPGQANLDPLAANALHSHVPDESALHFHQLASQQVVNVPDEVSYLQNKSHQIPIVGTSDDTVINQDLPEIECKKYNNLDYKSDNVTINVHCNDIDKNLLINNFTNPKYNKTTPYNSQKDLKIYDQQCGTSNDLLYNNFNSLMPTTHGITYSTISEILKNTYNFEESITSTALDILGMYLKGQKILYTEAKTLCEKRLYSLMLPAIFISASTILFSIMMNTYMAGSIIIAVLGVINSFILSLVTYLKLDAKAEAHKTSAYKYQKLQSFCEFKSGKILIFKNVDDVSDILADIEMKVMEIKESNQFILPELIRNSYPIIYSTNVFTLVKKIQNNEIIHINNLKIIIKKIIEKNKEKTLYENNSIIDNNKISLFKTEIELLEKERNTAFNDVILFREKYLDIDKAFNDEITEQRNHSTTTISCCNWLKT